MQNFKYSRICDRHFERSMFNNSNSHITSRLSTYAFPTLHLDKCDDQNTDTLHNGAEIDLQQTIPTLNNPDKFNDFDTMP